MTFGVKTNERPGTRAQVKYTRVSAYKAREILDLIRGERVARALEILEFAERDVAQVILKCLESAIANAEHNDQIPADELFVSACFADEGPTLKRWRPRARGRATRIRKRTCHITVIVSRLSPEELERLRALELASGGRGGAQAAAEARRQRVLRSRQAKADKKAAEAEEEHDHDHGAESEGTPEVAESEVEPEAAQDDTPAPEADVEPEVEVDRASDEADGPDADAEREDS
jgi:large subunit ribosomal protein L22